VSTSPSVATLCRTLPRQWLDLSLMISSSMKFVECLYCDVSPLPILHVPSCFAKVTCYIQSYNHSVIQVIHSYIHTFMHSCIHTSIRSYIHVFIHSCRHNMYATSFIHDCISHLESCLAVSLQLGPNPNNKWQFLYWNNLKIPCAKRIACNYLVPSEWLSNTFVPSE